MTALDPLELSPVGREVTPVACVLIVKGVLRTPAPTDSSAASVAELLRIVAPSMILGTDARLTLPVPNDASLIGLSVFIQGTQIEIGAALTASNTKYAGVVIGQLPQLGGHV